MHMTSGARRCAAAAIRLCRRAHPAPSMRTTREVDHPPISSRQLSQFVTAAVTREITSLFVPGTQHDTLCRLAVHDHVVNRRAMGMAVYDPPDSCRAECAHDRSGVHVHDVGDGS